MKRIALILSTLLLLAACGTKQSEPLTKKSSSGKTLEVLLAADKNVYIGEVKNLFDSIFREPQLSLPQPEPRFSVVTVPVSSLHNTQMFQMHRNIIVFDVRPDNPDKVYIRHDQWAAPQVIVELAAKSSQSLCMLLRKHHAQILDELYNAEYRRMDRAFYDMRNVDLMHRFQDKFGFGLTLSEDFTWAREDGEFVWVRKETKDFSLGILVHTMEYKNENQFDTVKIYNRLDTMMRRYVPGPTEGSYMGTERRISLDSRKVDFNGSNYCIETRGLWRTFGDFMGGPFVSYTVLSPDSKQIVDITGFVYCPRSDRYSKRDLLMQVDGICRSLKWSEE